LHPSAPDWVSGLPHHAPKAKSSITTVIDGFILSKTNAAIFKSQEYPIRGNPSPTQLWSFIINLGYSDTPNHTRSIYHREALYSLVLQRDLITQRVELNEA